MRFAAVLLFLFLFHPHLPAQTLVDSLTKATRSADSSLRSTTDNLSRIKDSLERAAMQQNLDRNSRPLNEFLEEMRENERRETRRIYFRVGFGVLFLIVLVIALARRRKKHRNR